MNGVAGWDGRAVFPDGGTLCFLSFFFFFLPGRNFGLAVLFLKQNYQFHPTISLFLYDSHSFIRSGVRLLVFNWSARHIQNPDRYPPRRYGPAIYRGRLPLRLGRISL